jgi:hypothetical protein
MKSNTLKKVLSIIIIAIISAVVITTCVLAFVQKSLYNPITEISTDMDAFYTLTVYKDGYFGVHENSDSETEYKKQVIKDVKDMQINSTKASILSLMFQGTSDFEPRIITSDAGNVMTSIAKAKGNVCLVYDFLDDEQTLMWEGVAYKNSQAKDPNAPVKFQKLFIPINNTEEFGVCTAYLADQDNKSSYQIEFLAHQSEIYEYLTNITWDYIITNNK